MKLIAHTFLVAFLLAANFGRTQAQEGKDPIDKTLDTCLNGPTGASTVGQLDCASKAAADWDAELNKTYTALMKSLDAPSRDLLRASERQWLAFRDAEKKFQAGPWTKGKGTLIGVSVSLANVDIVRSRVLTLRNYSGGGNPQ